MKHRSINEVMTTSVQIVRSDSTLREAAAAMAKEDVGSLPVSEGDRLVGMITDRDIAIRAIAKGLDGNALVRDVMTDGVKYCFDDEEISHVAQNMGELGVRRLPVINRDKRIVGMVSMSNIVHSGEAKSAQSFVRDVARPHQH